MPTLSGIRNCISAKQKELEKIWERMQDPTTAGKLRAKTRPDILAKEVERFYDTYARLSESKKLAGRNLTDKEIETAREALDESLTQLMRRQNEIAHNSKIEGEMREGIRALVSLPDYKMSATEVVDSMLHIGPQKAAYSLDGKIRGWKNALNTRMSEVLSTLAQESKYFVSKSDVGYGDAVGESLFRLAKDDKTPVLSHKDLPRFAEGLGKLSSEFADALFNRGLDIRKMNSFEWWMRADTSIDRVGTLSREEFANQGMSRIGDMLDWERIGKASGATYKTAEAKKSWFEGLYEEIIRGDYERAEGGLVRDAVPTYVASQATKAGKKREQARTIFFKDFNGWKIWSESFGNGGNFTKHITKMIDSTATTLGGLDTFGTRPQNTISSMMGELFEQYGGSISGTTMDTIQNRVTSDYNFYMGKLRNPLSYKAKSVIAGTRNTLRSAFLGTHNISAFTTEGFGLLPRAKAMMGSPMATEMMSNLSSMVERGQMEAIGRNVVYMDDVIRQIHLDRNSVYATGFEKATKQAADFVEKASGNAFLSDSYKQHAQTQFEFGVVDFIRSKASPEVADVMDDIMSEPFVGFLQRWGLDPQELLTLDKYIVNSGTEAKPLYTLEWDQIPLTSKEYDIVVKYNAAKAAFQETASPTVNNALNARVAAIMAATNSPTIAAGLAFSLQFMQYPAMVFRMVTHPTWKSGSPLQRTQNVMTMVLWMTTMGAIDVQLRHAVNGRKFEEATPELLFKGFMRAGVGGVLQDVILSAGTNPRGGMLDKFVPLAGPAGDVLKMGGRQIKRISEGKFTAGDLGYDLTKVLGQLVPGRNLWWTTALYQRMMQDQLKKELDAKRFRQEKSGKESRDKKQGTERYWNIGEPLPFQ